MGHKSSKNQANKSQRDLNRLQKELPDFSFASGSPMQELLMPEAVADGPTAEDSFRAIFQQVDKNKDGVLQRCEIDDFVHDAFIFFGNHIHSMMIGSPWCEVASVKLCDICTVEGLGANETIRSYAKLPEPLATKVKESVAASLMVLVNGDKNGSINFEEFNTFHWRDMVGQLKELKSH